MTLRFAYLAVLRVCGWLALLACSDRGKDAKILILRHQGRRAPASGKGTQTVLGRPGGSGRAGPVAVPRPPPPVTPDRLPTDPAAPAGAGKFGRDMCGAAPIADSKLCTRARCSISCVAPSKRTIAALRRSRFPRCHARTRALSAQASACGRPRSLRAE
jgi:hypothetical protein